MIYMAIGNVTGLCTAFIHLQNRLWTPSRCKPVTQTVALVPLSPCPNSRARAFLQRYVHAILNRSRSVIHWLGHRLRPAACASVPTPYALDVHGRPQGAPPLKQSRSEQSERLHSAPCTLPLLTPPALPNPEARPRRHGLPGRAGRRREAIAGQRGLRRPRRRGGRGRVQGAPRHA